MPSRVCDGDGIERSPANKKTALNNGSSFGRKSNIKTVPRMSTQLNNPLPPGQLHSAMNPFSVNAKRRSSLAPVPYPLTGNLPPHRQMQMNHHQQALFQQQIQQQEQQQIQQHHRHRQQQQQMFMMQPPHSLPNSHGNRTSNNQFKTAIGTMPSQYNGHHPSSSRRPLSNNNNQLIPTLASSYKTPRHNHNASITNNIANTSRTNHPISNTTMQHNNNNSNGLGQFACAWRVLGACGHSNDSNILEVCGVCKVNKIHHPCQVMWEDKNNAEADSMMKYCPACHPYAKNPPPPPPPPPTNNNATQNRNASSLPKPTMPVELIAEAELLVEKSFSAQQYYDAKANESNKNEIATLLTMQIGMNQNHVTTNNQRVDGFKQKKWLGSRECQTTATLMKEELRRRLKALTALEKDPPKLKQISNMRLTEVLGKLQSTDFPPCASDEHWVLQKINEVLDGIEAAHQQQTAKNRQNAAHIRTSTRVKIRLIHAWLHEANRDILIKQFDAMKRTELDSRNSADRPMNIFESTVVIFNNSTWVPTSSSFPDLHSDFGTPMNLALIDGAEPLTAEDASKILGDLLSTWKRCDANWRQSGNGKGNLVRAGGQQQTVRVRLRGTNYSTEGIAGASIIDDEEEGNVVIEMMDDDRWSYCNQNTAVAYLWGILEELGLSPFATQNCERIGLVNGKPASARNTQGLSLSNNNTAARRRNIHTAAEQTMKELPKMMKECMLGLFSKKSSNELQISYNDQLRKERSHHANCENDFDEAQMAYVLYKHSTTSPAQEVLDLHASIVDRKKKALEESSAEVAKWKKKIDDLDAEMLADEIADEFESEAMSVNESIPAEENAAITDTTNHLEDANANADDDIGDKDLDDCVEEEEEEDNAELTMNINDDVGNEEVAKLTDEQYYSMYSDFGHAC